MDEDGYLFYIGRQKEMIIRGGVNIYPVEIENAIIEHPNVSETQVFSISDTRHGEEVCAWIKLKLDASKCEPEDIARFLLVPVIKHSGYTNKSNCKRSNFCFEQMNCGDFFVYLFTQTMVIQLIILVWAIIKINLQTACRPTIIK
ncbi:unnamed protein product [Rotaria socialis]|uniref:AMP-binding enzyme C-terminal domain-containing protein n=1 Tax=Rotaria socialis TaxID=392032 RepID=A0A817UC68_9BILA|nr:unnamed protein product [Rotaria socialis]CAF3366952.1 unnamed protein product [Rotaria socialis]CAF4535225.1 unnamed protein product [Rotaria socialis]CAF4649922.1 unnamed protein product [Rotaria socialis]